MWLFIKEGIKQSIKGFFDTFVHWRDHKLWWLAVVILTLIIAYVDYYGY